MASNQDPKTDAELQKILQDAVRKTNKVFRNPEKYMTRSRRTGDHIQYWVGPEGDLPKRARRAG